MFAGLATGGKLIKGQKDIAAAVSQPRETAEDRAMAYEAERYEAMYKDHEIEAFEAGYDSVEAYEHAISAGRARAAEEAKVRFQEQERMKKIKESIFQGTPYAYTDNPEMLKRGAK